MPTCYVIGSGNYFKKYTRELGSVFLLKLIKNPPFGLDPNFYEIIYVQHRSSKSLSILSQEIQIGKVLAAVEHQSQYQFMKLLTDVLSYLVGADFLHD